MNVGTDGMWNVTLNDLENWNTGLILKKRTNLKMKQFGNQAWK